MEKEIDIDIIIPVSERYEDINITELYNNYKDALDKSKYSAHFLYVLDGEWPSALQDLRKLQNEGENIKIIELAKKFGEATALTTAFELTKNDFILTLPAYYQVETSHIPDLVEELNRYDLVIARRSPRKDSVFNRALSTIFSKLVGFFTDTNFSDLGCGVRAINRKVIEEISLYGEQHRFIPILADQKGFRIKEVDIPQSVKEPQKRVYRFSVYPSRILDILNIFFLTKFTKKPLRFFGLIGTGLSAIGGIFLVYIVFERLFLGVPLSDRPSIILSSLLVVLGLQIFALGLIGELIIFTHAKEIKEYAVEKIIN